MKVSVIIPTFNGKSRIGQTIEALLGQDWSEPFEILVVDDGSIDGTADHVRSLDPVIHVLAQVNQGPAKARNFGAHTASGDIILFTDDDCVPEQGWITAMLRPFAAMPEIVGAKGIYKTEQKELVARFVQLEYEDKYDNMRGVHYIDFIDTYSAAYKLDIFLAFNGFDTSFPVACAEDVELSFRISAKGHKMVFCPDAVVYHTHPNSISNYLKKKYKFAFWRVVASRKNPQTIAKDAHTPQIMKLQLLLAPAIVASGLAGLFDPAFLWGTGGILGLFLLTTLPFAKKAIHKDRIAGLLSPGLLFLRSCAQFMGVVGGVVYVIKTALTGKSI